MEATVLVNTGPYQEFSQNTMLRDYYIQTPDPELNEHSSFPLHSSNAASFDYNPDGKKDIFVSGHHHNETTDDENRGFVGKTGGYTNEGVPWFSDESSASFDVDERPHSFTTGIIFADYDNDGLIDFYAPNPQFDDKGRRHRLYRNKGGGEFENVTSDAGLENLVEGSQRNDETVTGAWGDYNGDGFLDLLLMTANSNQTQFGPLPARSVRLFKNVTGGAGGARTFIDVTDAAGIDLSITGVHSALWADFDKDHDVDLVLVGYMDDGATLLSKYYKNLGNGVFGDSTITHLPNRSDWLENHGLASVGDFDNDADLDVVYHSQLRRAWYANDYNDGVGSGKLPRQWKEDQPANTLWEIEPSDLNVFDYNLDGFVDFSLGNYDSYLNDRPQHIFEKDDVGSGFSQMHISSMLSDRSSSFGLCAADFNLDGFTELYLGTSADRPFFFKAMQSYPVPTAEWVGIRLETVSTPFNSYTRPCNFRGVGATVTVSYGSYRQARLVDGGSGGAGQNDLDLSFGVPGAPSSVYVDISWPCGQDQRVLVPTGTYTTVSLGWPLVDDDSAGFDIIMTPGESDVSWEFTWETNYPGDDSMDMVEFMTGARVPLPPITQLTPSSNNVDHEVQWVEVPGDIQGKYLHKMTWNSVTCVAPLTVQYRVRSGFGNSQSTSNYKTRRIFVCPLVGP